MYKVYPGRRYRKTMQFLKKNTNPGDVILDLGVDNPFAELMRKEGYHVHNTKGEDLDDEYFHLNNIHANVVTSFQIFEHMFAPYNVLKSLNHKKIIITVPLKVWFSKSHWNNEDLRDRHFHEFEIRQFKALLEKTGWQIVDDEVWRIPDAVRLRFRPFLRFLWPTYYAVCCVRKS